MSDIIEQYNSSHKTPSTLPNPQISEIDVKTLLNFKFLFNPIRLMILKVINNHFCFSTSELRKILQIPWGTFNDHLKALIKRNYIEIGQEFINHSPVKIVNITYEGRREYQSLINILGKTIN
ncbi:MAG: transcriptional regulator [Candidatus Kariarchaeaceae archaeon]|jgi:DNA-binding MarR family transcriptional regulator